ncbi:MAG: hypothetical protein M5U08_18555 [Burkholderiales bacterium]|nr:hypothetical protein [Burkholderiales bacterium]
MKAFAERVAVITGTAGGLVRAFAFRFARERMRPVLAGADWRWASTCRA